MGSVTPLLIEDYTLGAWDAPRITLAPSHIVRAPTTFSPRLDFLQTYLFGLILLYSQVPNGRSETRGS